MASQSDEELYLLSTQDIRLLAQFLHNVLLHFNRYRSSSEGAFLNNVHVIADCYRLILLYAGKEVAFDERLRIFTHYFESKTPPLEMEKVALAIAEMINVVSDQIRLLSLPWFEAAYQAAIQDLLSDKWAYLHASNQAATLLRRKIHVNGLRRAG
jgi:hypothetical protein